MVNVDDLLQGVLDWAQVTVPMNPSTWQFYKEIMDYDIKDAQQLTVLHEGGRSSGRSAVDELDFSIVVVHPRYGSALDAAFSLYTKLHNLWDVLSSHATLYGYNGFWLLQPPRRVVLTDPALQGTNMYLVEAKTWAETRG